MQNTSQKEEDWLPGKKRDREDISIFFAESDEWKGEFTVALAAMFLFSASLKADIKKWTLTFESLAYLNLPPTTSNPFLTDNKVKFTPIEQNLPQ